MRVHRECAIGLDAYVYYMVDPLYLYPLGASHLPVTIRNYIP